VHQLAAGLLLAAAAAMQLSSLLACFDCVLNQMNKPLALAVCMPSLQQCVQSTGSLAAAVDASLLLFLSDAGAPTTFLSPSKLSCSGNQLRPSAP
jgi:hypothetical protein